MQNAPTDRLRFTKMHGLGNDFVVIDGVRQSVTLDAATVSRLADRHTGVGFDQLLLVEAAARPGVDFNYRIFNADGGEVEQCGNGARCFARFVRDQGLIDRDRIRVGTMRGELELVINADGRVTVDMGVPEFEPAQIPLDKGAPAAQYSLQADGQDVRFGAVAMGNPHMVMTVDDVDTAPVARLGPLLESHPLFPNRVNVGFMQVLSPSHIRLRVFERGVGETQACGSGACAAVAVGRRQGRLDASVQVDLHGGRLTIDWDGEGHLFMTGPVATVYEGTVSL